MFGQKRRMIDALDLSAIAVGVAWRHGWPPDRVKGAENEYRRFLYLLMLCPHQTLTPWCDDLDLFGTSTSCTPNDMRLIVSTFSDVSSTTIQRSRNGQSVRSRQSFKRYGPTIVHLDTELPKTTHRGTGQPLHLWRPSGPCYPLKPRPGSAGSGVGCGSGGGRPRLRGPWLRRRTLTREPSSARQNCSQSLDHAAGLFPAGFDQSGPSATDRLASSIGTLLPIALCGRSSL